MLFNTLAAAACILFSHFLKHLYTKAKKRALCLGAFSKNMVIHREDYCQRGAQSRDLVGKGPWGRGQEQRRSTALALFLHT